MPKCPHCHTEHLPGFATCLRPNAAPAGAIPPTPVDASDESPERSDLPSNVQTISVQQKEGETPFIEDDLAPGTPVDDYIVMHKLGSGGMGTVYLVQEKSINKMFAVKVLTYAGWQSASRLAEFEKEKARFHREAESVSNVKHQNVIETYKFGHLDDGRPYYVMEYLPGKALGDLLREDPPPSTQLRDWLCQTCDALIAIHKEGIIHRDLKPQNIHIVEPTHGEPFAKVLDFGIAKIGNKPRITKTGLNPCTPWYASPEQVQGQEVDNRSDIYSFGAVLYEVFTGRVPFNAENTNRTVVDVVTREPDPPVAREGRSISPALARLILDCLGKDPDKRPQSAVELKSRLLEALHDDEVVVESGRSRLPKVALGLAAIALAGGVLVGVRLWTGSAAYPIPTEEAAPPKTPSPVGRRSPAPPLPASVTAETPPTPAAEPAMPSRRLAGKTRRSNAVPGAAIPGLGGLPEDRAATLVPPAPPVSPPANIPKSPPIPSERGLGIPSEAEGAEGLIYRDLRRSR